MWNLIPSDETSPRITLESRMKFLLNAQDYNCYTTDISTVVLKKFHQIPSSKSDALRLLVVMRLLWLSIIILFITVLTSSVCKFNLRTFYKTTVQLKPRLLVQRRFQNKLHFLLLLNLFPSLQELLLALHTPKNLLRNIFLI